jgi:hypothetical protein
MITAKVVSDMKLHRFPPDLMQSCSAGQPVCSQCGISADDRRVQDPCKGSPIVERTFEPTEVQKEEGIA